MIRKMIPAAAAFAVAAVALAGPAHASEQPQSSAHQTQQDGKGRDTKDKDTKGKGGESAAVKKARALCLSTGRKDQELTVKISRLSDAKGSASVLRVKAAKLKKGDTRKAALIKRAKAKEAELAALRKQRAELVKTLRWCKANGHATA